MPDTLPHIVSGPKTDPIAPMCWTAQCRRMAVVFGWAAGCLMGLAAPAAACSVPVFRYAIERWPSDAFEISVVHREPLTPAQRTLVDRLRQHATHSGARANLAVRAVAVASAQPIDLEQLPWIVARYPRAAGIDSPAWSGPLTSASVEMVVDSPIRQRIVKHLVDDDAVVWALLESGQRDKDVSAAELLREELAQLVRTLTLQETVGEVATEPATAGNAEAVPIVFSVVRVARTDPAEAALVSMLLGTEPDLRTYREPIVFPIFGRGRVLYALVGAGITRETIGEAARYLVGACSCQVKEENPGLDLLMMANWSRGLDASIDIDAMPQPAVTGLPDLSLAIAGPACVADSGSAATTSSPAGGSVLLRNTAVVATGTVMAIVVMLICLRRRSVT